MSAPCAPGRGSAAGRKFLAPPYYSQCAVFMSLQELFRCIFSHPCRHPGAFVPIAIWVIIAASIPATSVSILWYTFGIHGFPVISVLIPYSSLLCANLWEVPVIALTYFSQLMCLLHNAAPCGLRSCKNRPALFPGQMSYKATKPGSVCPLSLSLDFFSVCLLYC